MPIRFDKFAFRGFHRSTERPLSRTASQSQPQLAGLHILVVEDMFIVAQEIEEMLRTMQCNVVGPVSRCSAAIGLIEDQAIDAAVLDVNLGEEECYPIADALRERGIPFVFATGYGAEQITRDEYANAPILEKPFMPVELRQVLMQALRER